MRPCNGSMSGHGAPVDAFYAIVDRQWIWRYTDVLDAADEVGLHVPSHLSAPLNVLRWRMGWRMAAADRFNLAHVVEGLDAATIRRIHNQEANSHFNIATLIRMGLCVGASAIELAQILARNPAAWTLELIFACEPLPSLDDIVRYRLLFVGGYHDQCCPPMTVAMAQTIKHVGDIVRAWALTKQVRAFLYERNIPEPTRTVLLGTLLKALPPPEWRMRQLRALGSVGP